MKSNLNVLVNVAIINFTQQYQQLAHLSSSTNNSNHILSYTLTWGEKSRKCLNSIHMCADSSRLMCGFTCCFFVLLFKSNSIQISSYYHYIYLYIEYIPLGCFICSLYSFEYLEYALISDKLYVINAFDSDELHIVYGYTQT